MIFLLLKDPGRAETNEQSGSSRRGMRLWMDLALAGIWAVLGRCSARLRIPGRLCSPSSWHVLVGDPLLSAWWLEPSPEVPSPGGLRLFYSQCYCQEVIFIFCNRTRLRELKKLDLLSLKTDWLLPPPGRHWKLFTQSINYRLPFFPWLTPQTPTLSHFT